MKKESEFGRGLVICLSKFYQHFATDMLSRARFCHRISQMSKGDQGKVMSDSPPANLNYGKDMNNYFKYWKTKLAPIVGGEKEQTSHDVTLWANGASDHLYEIKIPAGKGWGRIGKIVGELKEKGLNMGHGDGLMGRRVYTLEDVDKLYELTEKALVMIDKKLGIKDADIGEF